MKLRTLSVLLVLVLLVLFTLLNWSVMLAPTALSLGVTQVQAPLGLIMLVLIGLVIAVFLVYILYLQSSVLLDARNHAKELQANRKLADQNEASRFTELRVFLEAELKNMAHSQVEAQTKLAARLDQLESKLCLTVEQSDNALAASIAEMDDRWQAINAGAGAVRE